MQILFSTAVLLIVLIVVLMKFDFIVIDRRVFNFQISHIVKRGKINNLREYKAILNAVEQRFEEDNEGFVNDPEVGILNNLLAAFHMEAGRTQ